MRTHRQEGALWVLSSQFDQCWMEAAAGDAPGHEIVGNDQCVPCYGLQKIFGCPHTQEIVWEWILIPVRGNTHL